MCKFGYIMKGGSCVSAYGVLALSTNANATAEELEFAQQQDNAIALNVMIGGMWVAGFAIAFMAGALMVYKKLNKQTEENSYEPLLE